MHYSGAYKKLLLHHNERINFDSQLSVAEFSRFYTFLLNRENVNFQPD